MWKDDAKETLMSAARNYLAVLAENLQLDFVIRQKELVVELGGYYTSDFEELATGQWDVYTQREKTNYKFFGYEPKFNDKVIVKSREYSYETNIQEVKFVSEKITFSIPSVPTDADFSIEFGHEIPTGGDYARWRRKREDYYYLAPKCKCTFKVRDSDLCSFEIEMEQEEERIAVESVLYPN